MLSIKIVQYAIAVHQTLALMCGVFMYGQFIWAQHVLHNLPLAIAWKNCEMRGNTPADFHHIIPRQSYLRPSLHEP